MGDYHDETALPSLETFKIVLGGYVSASGVLRFPRPPGDDVKDRSCTLKLDPAAQDGFVVADARKIIDGLKLKDHVREKVGLPPFSRASPRRSNGVAKNHRPAGGPIAHDHPQPTKRIELIHFSEIRISTHRRDLVRDIIPLDCLTLVWGAPKSGKSFWVLDLMMHVALGWEYRGRKVHQGPVVLCAFEGQTGVKTRVEAFRRTRMAEDTATQEVPFYLVTTRLALVKDQGALIEAIQQSVGEARPVMIVLDTLNKSFTGSESSDADMTAYVDAADEIRQMFQCAVVIVHHCGHEATRARGHTALLGALGAEISVKKEDATKIVTTTVLHLKDGEGGTVLASRLQPIELGQDEDGHPISSCVVEALDPNVLSVSKPRVSGATALALRLLEEVVHEHGELTPATGRIPAKTWTVPAEKWRQAFLASSITDSDKPDSQSRAFRRCVDRLQSLGEIGIWKDRVWLAGQSRTSRTGQQLSGPPLPGQTRTPPYKGGVLSGEAEPGA